MASPTPKSHAVIVIALAAAAVLVTMGGLLIVPDRAILVLTVATGFVGIAALWMAPTFVLNEKFRREASGEGTGAGDGTARRYVCSECSWHWRAGAGGAGEAGEAGGATDGQTCPRCAGRPIEGANRPR